jgi:hypothetical protein
MTWSPPRERARLPGFRRPHHDAGVRPSMLDHAGLYPSSPLPDAHVFASTPTGRQELPLHPPLSATTGPPARCFLSSPSTPPSASSTLPCCGRRTLLLKAVHVRVSRAASWRSFGLLRLRRPVLFVSNGPCRPLQDPPRRPRLPSVNLQAAASRQRLLFSAATVSASPSPSALQFRQVKPHLQTYLNIRGLTSSHPNEQRSGVSPLRFLRRSWVRIIGKTRNQPFWGFSLQSSTDMRAFPVSRSQKQRPESASSAPCQRDDPARQPRCLALFR